MKDIIQYQNECFNSKIPDFIPNFCAENNIIIVFRASAYNVSMLKRIQYEEDGDKNGYRY